MIWLAEEIQFPIMNHTLISKETKNNEEKGKSLSFFLSNSAHNGTQNINGELSLFVAIAVMWRSSRPYNGWNAFTGMNATCLTEGQNLRKNV
jgi:hypothetical protein